MEHYTCRDRTTPPQRAAALLCSEHVFRNLTRKCSIYHVAARGVVVVEPSGKQRGHALKIRVASKAYVMIGLCVAQHPGTDLPPGKRHTCKLWTAYRESDCA